MQKMNTKDMNELLERFITENETYLAKVWGVLTEVEGQKAKAYCYIGLTEVALKIVIVNASKISEVLTALSIPLVDITKVEVKKSGTITQRLVSLYMNEVKYTLSIMLNSWLSDVKKQKENGQYLIKKLEEL